MLSPAKNLGARRDRFFAALRMTVPFSVVHVYNRRCANELCAYESLPISVVKLHYQPSSKAARRIESYAASLSLASCGEILARDTKMAVLTSPPEVSSSVLAAS
jgi:hypothetical protein